MTIAVTHFGKNSNQYVFSAIANGEETDALELKNGTGLAASVQVTGTLGGGTVTLEVSNDGVAFYDWVDVNNDAIALTAVGYAEFCVAARYIRFGLAGGTAGAMIAIVVAQG